jgi:hypothetical protein
LARLSARLVSGESLQEVELAPIEATLADLVDYA